MPAHTAHRSSTSQSSSTIPSSSSGSSSSVLKSPDLSLVPQIPDDGVSGRKRRGEDVLLLVVPSERSDVSRFGGGRSGSVVDGGGGDGGHVPDKDLQRGGKEGGTSSTAGSASILLSHLERKGKTHLSFAGSGSKKLLLPVVEVESSDGSLVFRSLEDGRVGSTEM